MKLLKLDLMLRHSRPSSPSTHRQSTLSNRLPPRARHSPPTPPALPAPHTPRVPHTPSAKLPSASRALYEVHTRRPFALFRAGQLGPSVEVRLGGVHARGIKLPSPCPSCAARAVKRAARRRREEAARGGRGESGGRREGRDRGDGGVQGWDRGGGKEEGYFGRVAVAGEEDGEIVVCDVTRRDEDENWCEKEKETRKEPDRPRACKTPHTTNT